ARGVVASGVREEAMRFGAGGEIFGVLTEPVDAHSNKPLILFSNTAGNHRIGPNRMYVEMGRKWASLGFPSVRIDVSGIGDSVTPREAPLNHPPPARLVEDAVAVMRSLKSSGRAHRFLVMGLCSGAFVAYHAALAEPSVVGVALLNPQTFKWEEGMSLEVNPLKKREAAEYYKRRMFTKEAWTKLLQGGVDVKHALGVFRGRAIDVVRARVAAAKARLPGAASRGSEVARAFDALTTRGADVLIVFSSGDPGI